MKLKRNKNSQSSYCTTFDNYNYLCKYQHHTKNMHNTEIFICDTLTESLCICSLFNLCAFVEENCSVSVNEHGISLK